MKKINLTLILILCSILANAQLKVESDGRVRVGGVYNELQNTMLHIQGTTRFSAWSDVIMDNTGNWATFCMYPETSGHLTLGKNNNRLWDIYTNYLYYQSLFKYSDSLTKDDIEPLGSMLSKLNQINAYSYKYKPEFQPISYEGNVARRIEPQTEYGVLAQEVYEVFPHLVNKPDSGMMSVDYTGLIPILMQSIKEQQVQIGALQYKVQQLERASDITSVETLDLTQSTHLEQNFPNPFNTKTEVNYFVTKTAKEASIMIFDMSGVLIKTYENIEKGDAKIIIDAKLFKAGMYLYSLIVDGVEMDSKKMILTK